MQVSLALVGLRGAAEVQSCCSLGVRKMGVRGGAGGWLQLAEAGLERLDGSAAASLPNLAICYYRSGHLHKGILLPTLEYSIAVPNGATIRQHMRQT